MGWEGIRTGTYPEAQLSILKGLSPNYNMVERVGILVVSYGSRAASMVDAFSRSENYRVELYIADKQRNPFNLERAKEHVVIPDLDIEKISNFAKKHRDEIDFGIVGPEGPIISGIRDLVERETKIPIICPTREFALEESKLLQRILLRECCPEANPRFRVFDPREYDRNEVKKELWSWLDELNNEVAVKPDRPGYGKGVGVWGDHFNTRDELFEHFLSIFEHDSVIVEEKIHGEESSFQCFCDGKNLAVLPDTRDYKRAFENDEGPNTGGMGCYKDKGDYLPFMNSEDRENEINAVNKIFKRLKGNGSNPGLRGIPFYVAFIHGKDGAKILEINSRGGDPEIQTVIPLLRNDFVDVCFGMIDGNLKKIEIEEKSAVLTYKVPLGYGEYKERFPGRVNVGEIGTPVDLNNAYKLKEKYGDTIRIYPGSLEVRGGRNYALGSRAVCCIGISETIEGAREISLEGINSITGGALWYRRDIASREHIKGSMEHMEKLRGKI